MERLTYTALEQGRYDGYLLRQAPERVLQFGEGNFLRGFAEHFIDVMNERTDFQGKVVVVPPASAGKTGRINDQEGLYQLCLRGRRNGETVDQCRIVSCISRAVDVFEEYDAFLRTAHNPNMRFILSNTTEAGIVYEPSSRMDDRPPAGFPAKLARLLWERYQTGLPGYIIFPCELIADNGGTLRDCVLRHARDWGLEAGFSAGWRRRTPFAALWWTALLPAIPRSRPGRWRRPQAWRTSCWMWRSPSPSVIEAPEWVQGEFPAEQAGLPVRFVAVTAPTGSGRCAFSTGPHCPDPGGPPLRAHAGAHLHGGPGAEELPGWGAVSGDYPTLSLPRAECEDFALAVEERFDNPYVDHRLVDIALNSVSKWRARVLPSVEAFHRPAGGAAPPAGIFFCGPLRPLQPGRGGGVPSAGRAGCAGFLRPAPGGRTGGAGRRLCRQGGLLGPGSDRAARLRPRRGAGPWPASGPMAWPRRWRPAGRRR